MYLNKKTYIGNVYKDSKDRIKLSSGLIKLGIKEEKLTSVTEQAAYWRKNNQIHAWFVKNIQGGKDDCAEYTVSRSSLQNLLDTVNEVIRDSKLIDGKVTNGYSFKDGKEIPNIQEGKIIEDPSAAIALLPVQEGFFFGSAEYNEWYLDGLKYTQKVLTELLESHNEDNPWIDYTYQSSW
jgi:hypothetical protein